MVFSAGGAGVAYADNGSELSRYFEDKAVWLPEQTINSPTAAYVGQYGYYSDLENGFFYLHISYNESSITDSENVVSVKFNIENRSREYQFNIDENGFITSEDDIEHSFEIIAEFCTPSQQGQEIYIGIRFLDKGDKVLNNVISFSIRVNGSTYKLCNDIVLEYETLTTTKASPTKQSTTKKESTEKQGANTDKKESTTKFKYNGGSASSGKFTYSGGDHDEYYESDGSGQVQNLQSENGAVISAQGSLSSLSPTAKGLYAAAIALAVSGTIVILYNASKSREEKQEKQKGNGEDQQV